MERESLAILNKVLEDLRVGPAHISLAAAILRLREEQHTGNTVFCKGRELRKYAKIGSRSTYHKCLRDLRNAGYIYYKPCFNHRHGSKIIILNNCAEWI